MSRIYQQVDVIMLPVLDGIDKDFFEDRYNVLANLIGAPAISIPTSKINGLPWGIQVVSNRYRDDIACQVALFLESYKFN